MFCTYGRLYICILVCGAKAFFMAVFKIKIVQNLAFFKIFGIFQDQRFLAFFKDFWHFLAFFKIKIFGF